MPTTPKSPPSASSSEPPKPSRTYHRPKRKPGAQPGNLNALTHGFYSHALSAAQALELHDAQALPTDDLSDEIAILRQRLLQLIKNEPDNLDLLFAGVRALANLARAHYHLKGTDADRLVGAMQTVLQSIEDTLATPPEAA